MTYTPLTPEQFQKAVDSGFTTEQIIEHEKTRKQKESQQRPQQEFVQEKLTAQKVLGGIASLTGGKELASGIASAIGGEKLGDSITQSTKMQTDLIAKAKTLPRGSPERKALLDRVSAMAQSDSSMASAQLGEMPTNKQVLGSAGKLALTVGTLGTGGVAKNLAGRILEGGLTGAAYQSLANLEGEKPIKTGLKTAAVIGGAIPLVGAGLTKARELLGKGTQKAGEKIVYSTIKPSQADIKDGFDVRTISKYDLNGSLDQMLGKTEDKMQSLVKELQGKIKSTDAVVNLNDVAMKTTKRLLAGGKQANFGNSGAVKRVLDSLATEIEDVSANGLVSLSESQVIKQAAGKKGAWVFGNVDPDARAIERVYSTFYQELKSEIERLAPTGVRGINKQLSELIPVANALIRRIPVATRNNALGLTDLMTLGATAVNPSMWPLILAGKLSQSPRFGSLLAEFGQRVAERGPSVTNVGKRIFGR